MAQRVEVNSYLSIATYHMYQKEAEQQLSNEHFYTRLETDRTDEINTFIKSEIDSMICARDLPDTAAALLVEKPKCSNFYILLKFSFKFKQL